MFVTLLLLVSAAGASRHAAYHHLGNKRVELTPIDGRFFAMLVDESFESSVAETLSREGAKVTNTRLPGLLRVDANPTDLARSFMETARTDSRILWSEPAYLLNDREITVAGALEVKFTSNANRDDLNILNKMYHSSWGRALKTAITTHQLILGHDRELDALDLLVVYQDHPSIEYIDPVFVELESPFLSPPDDPLYPSQWGLNQIDVLGAWLAGALGFDTVIAIMDSGVDVDHPDLWFHVDENISRTFGNGDPPTGNGDAPCDCPSGHGTCVAGIAGAVINNSIGIAGVTQATIMSLRIINDHEFAANVRNAIFYAWNEGAHVINMSFHLTETQAIQDELAAAAADGRDGFGTVLVAAAGNSGDSIDFPARDPHVIAVGASTETDARVANEPFTNLCDGNPYTWSSDYGDEMDLVAPGRGDIYSTDVEGACGYVAGEYHSDFFGTSAAAPFVTGVAGLILDLEPNFPVDGVRGFIAESADLVQGHTTWHQEYGWGRLNAYNAVTAVQNRDPSLVYVNALNENSTYPNQVKETGVTMANGFNTFVEGMQALASNGQMVMGLGTYQAPSLIGQPMTLTASGGTVIIEAFP